jgi:hypothetical protein
MEPATSSLAINAPLRAVPGAERLLDTARVHRGQRCSTGVRLGHLGQQLPRPGREHGEAAALPAWGGRARWSRARAAVAMPAVSLLERGHSERNSALKADNQASRSRRRLGRPLVVVNVSFSPVLLLLVIVGVVGMGNWRVVVLMGVCRRQVCPLLALSEVVGDVGVLVLVHLRVMTVLLCCHHTLLQLSAPGRLTQVLD